MKKGYIQVYTGNGKGKTTAALGITLRCLCAGGKVFFGQFMKGQICSESKAAEIFTGLTMEQFGEPSFVNGEATEEDILRAQAGIKRAAEVLKSGEYDMVVLDEINTAVYFELISVGDVLELLESKDIHTEVILTGRYAPQEIIEFADLVTEMKEIKHYFNEGVDARRGIEN